MTDFAISDQDVVSDDAASLLPMTGAAVPSDLFDAAPPALRSAAAVPSGAAAVVVDDDAAAEAPGMVIVGLDMDAEPDAGRADIARRLALVEAELRQLRSNNATFERAVETTADMEARHCQNL